MNRTSIGWTGWSWNFLRGCSRVSNGCTRCYAEVTALRFSGKGMPYEGLVRRSKHGEARWTGDVRFVAEKLAEPLRKRKGGLVFVNSMSDFFHEEVAFETMAAAYGVMAAAPQHTFQILTKRAARIPAFFRWLERMCERGPGYGALSPLGVCLHYAQKHCDHRKLRDADAILSRAWPLENVHVGVSIEDDETAANRIPLLLLAECPIAVRWVSYEPCLGYADLRPFLPAVVLSEGVRPKQETVDAIAVHRRSRREYKPTLDWIVIGGESGPRARPFNILTAQELVEVCARRAVPVFVKQLGKRPCRIHRYGTVPCSGNGCGDGDWCSAHELQPLRLKSPKGEDPTEWPEGLAVQQRVPKLRAGRK